MIAAAIIVCEVAFWLLLLAGLTARYAFGRQRLGTILLICVPIVDLLLLAVVAVDLANGAQAQGTHGLAAIYLGFSVALGPDIIRAADRRFARRFGPDSGPGNDQPPTEDRLRREWQLWGRCVLACALADVTLGALILVAGNADQTRALWENGGSFVQLGVVCALWLLLGPVWAAIREGRLR